MGQSKYTIMTWLSLPIFVSTLQNEWRPLKTKLDYPTETKAPSHGRTLNRKTEPLLDNCSLYKAVMDQHAFYQVLIFLCWLFSRQIVPHKRRAIFSRIANTAKRSYYMLSINDHTIYRINYPIKLFKWYHSCQSWNGNTGEWQIWINNERIARGYYNLMIGKSIKSGGIAISGQENIEHENVIFNNKKKRIGFQGELTLLQLYKAALSKGKAYSNHKHHHGYDSNNKENDVDSFDEIDTYTLLETSQKLSTEHTLFENGQLKPHLPVHELIIKKNPKAAQDLQILMLENPTSSASLKFEEPSIFEKDYRNAHRLQTNRNEKQHEQHDSKIIMKRNNIINENSSTAELLNTKRNFSNIIMKNLPLATFSERYAIENKQNPSKRMLAMEDNISLSDSNLSSGSLYFYSKKNEEKHAYNDVPKVFFQGNNIGEKKLDKLEYEPAEWEVRKIIEICDACEEDPFSKANVLSWQETHKKLFAGAQYLPSVAKCHNF